MDLLCFANTCRSNAAPTTFCGKLIRGKDEDVGGEDGLGPKNTDSLSKTPL